MAIGLLGTLLGGCSAAVVKQSTLELQAETVSFTIPSELYGDQEQTLSAFKKAYAHSLVSTTGLIRLSRYDGTLEKGVASSIAQDGVKLSYVHQSSTSNNPLRNNLTGNFKTAISRDSSGNFLIKVNCPSQLDVETRAFESGVLAGWNPFIPPEDAKKNVAMVCRNASVDLQKRNTGSIDTNFPEKSVLTNFERKLGGSGYKPNPYDMDRMGLPIAEAAKYKWFNFVEGNNRIQLALAVYPYRNGSKVNYTYVSSAMCRPNATCIYDKDGSKRVNQKITEIAND